MVFLKPDAGEIISDWQIIGLLVVDYLMEIFFEKLTLSVESFVMFHTRHVFFTCPASEETGWVVVVVVVVE